MEDNQDSQDERYEAQDDGRGSENRASGFGSTEVTHESWFSRIGNAIGGVLVGVLLFVVAFPILFWNEGRAVQTYRALAEGAKSVVSVASDKVNAANDGKLVYLTGKAETEAKLSDPVFGVSAKAIRLKRIVEMYQWKEAEKSTTHKNLGGSKETVHEYSYAKQWSEQLIKSDHFKTAANHHNPDSMPYSSLVQDSKDVKLGAFTLSSSLIGKINQTEPLVMASNQPLPEAIKAKAQLYDGGIYMGAAPASPKVGDVRVKFELVTPTEVSLVARQTDHTFSSYTTKAGDSIELLQVGVHPVDEMFKKAQQNNSWVTWFIRFCGFVLMFIGVTMIFKPLSVLADILPIFGSIVEFGTGLIAFLVASAFSSLTMAVAWIFYRPLLGILLLGIAAALGGTLISKLRKSK